MCLGNKAGLGSFLENAGFVPFLTYLWSQIGRFSRPFQPLEWPKLFNMASKWAHFTCLYSPKRPKVSADKHFLEPFLTHFLPQNNPL